MDPPLRVAVPFRIRSALGPAPLFVTLNWPVPVFENAPATVNWPGPRIVPLLSAAPVAIEEAARVTSPENVMNPPPVRDRAPALAVAATLTSSPAPMFTLSPESGTSAHDQFAALCQLPVPVKSQFAADAADGRHRKSDGEGGGGERDRQRAHGRLLLLGHAEHVLLGQLADELWVVLVDVSPARE